MRALRYQAGSMTPAPSAQRTIRALVAVGDDVLRDIVGRVLAEAAGIHVSAEVHAPPAIDEAALRAFAESVPFDVCFLTLNNIRYDRHEPIEARLQSSVTLVRDLVRLYSKPVLALYGWPDDAEYPA